MNECSVEKSTNSCTYHIFLHKVFRIFPHVHTKTLQETLPASIYITLKHTKKILISMLIPLSFKSTTAGNDHGKRKEKLDKYNMQRNININMIQIPCKVCMIKTLYHSHQSFSLWWLGDFSLFVPLSFGTALSGCQSEGLSETGTWIEVGQS